MPNFRVFHKNKPDFSDEITDWPDGYTFVASVTTTRLDHVFELTNHIDRPWTQNPGVSAFGSRHRSTSVGDIVIDQYGKAWACSAIGWRPIPGGESGQECDHCGAVQDCREDCPRPEERFK